jgi:hypothetical protein
MKENLLLPIQVEYLIKNLLDTKQSIHIRNNYKYSLENIRTAINQSISDFDRQNNTDNMFTAKKKR